MEVVKKLFGSRKALACMAGLLAIILDSVGVSFLDEAGLMKVLGILSAFIVGQGIADVGKSSQPDKS